MKYILFIASFALISSSTMKADFSGEWEYRYSVAKSETVQGNITQPANQKLVIATDSLMLGYKLVFGKSDLKNEQNDMPQTVLNMRENDSYFKNVSFTAFKKDGKPIDVFYPASHSTDEKGRIHFTAYGKYHKDDFTLDISKKDTLIITDHRYFMNNGHKYSQAGHVYVKTRNAK